MEGFRKEGWREFGWVGGCGALDSSLEKGKGVVGAVRQG